MTCHPLRILILGLIALAIVAIPKYGSAARLSHLQESETPAVGDCMPVPEGATPDATPAAAGNAADYPFDLVFIDAMLFNHEASVAMAEIARQSSERPEILD